MGSSYGSDSTILRKTLVLKTRQLEMKSLRDLSLELKKVKRLTFARRYGKILDLLELEVQSGALTALAQYYDPPLRCFTFQDFQLAPTLEELGWILGYPLEKGKPYLYSWHYPSLDTVAETLRIRPKELKDKMHDKNGVNGFSRKYLEERAQYLAKKGDWDL